MAHDDDRLGARQPELQPLLKEVRELNDQLLQLHAGGRLDGARRQFQQQDRLEQQLRTVNGAMEMRTRPDNGPRLPSAVRASDLAAALPPGTALVEYYAIISAAVPEGEKARRVLEDSGDEWLLPPRRAERYVAFVVLAGDERVTFVDLGEAAGIERLADSYLVAMSGGRRDLVAREREHDLDEAPEEELSRALRARLFDPLAGALGGRSTVFIAPDGVVCRIPFSALIEQEGPGRLLDRLTIGYVATGRGVLDFRRPPTPPGEPPVVVGDPDYDFVKPGESPEPAPAVDGFVSFHFDRLPGTADEAWRVSQLVGGRRLTGKKAHETALRECRSPAILHVASHGYYVRPFAQGVHVIGHWRESLGSLFRGEVLGRAGNPFLRSGIALAGVNAWSANRPLPAEAGDGLLTSAEVAHIDLEGTELVVLSACSGALGDVMPGNGVAGLLHGFHVAGARATVASLWRIPDEITEHLMRAFYERLLQGVPRLEALRQAQRELNASGRAVGIVRRVRRPGTARVSAGYGYKRI